MYIAKFGVSEESLNPSQLLNVLLGVRKPNRSQMKLVVALQRRDAAAQTGKCFT